MVFCCDGVERAIDDAFGGGLLAVIHQAVHEFGEDQIAKFGVRVDFAAFCAVAAGHDFVPSRFARLLRTLGAVERAALLAVLHALRVEHAADDVIAHARKSFTRPPRISTTECSCRLWPSPGNVAHDFDSRLVRRTLATLRSAEFGFFGVVV